MPQELHQIELDYEGGVIHQDCPPNTWVMTNVSEYRSAIPESYARKLHSMLRMHSAHEEISEIMTVFNRYDEKTAANDLDFRLEVYNRHLRVASGCNVYHANDFYEYRTSGFSPEAIRTIIASGIQALGPLPIMPTGVSGNLPDLDNWYLNLFPQIHSAWK
jgi:hypothetical protein